MDYITKDAGGLDPCELSKKYLIALMFLQSSSSNYKEAVSVAGTASFFRQVSIEGKQINFVGFAKTQKDISRLLTIQAIICNWKGTQFFAGGHALANPYSLNQTIDCYLQSLACRSIEAHCLEIIEHPFYKRDRYSGGGVKIGVSVLFDDVPFINEKPPEPTPLFLNPCKRLYLNDLSKHHPSNIIDQIQAVAVEKNIDWCPNFQVDKARKIER